MGEDDRALSAYVLRMWLAEHLRSYRDATGLSQKDAADLLSWSVSKLQRVEAAAVGVSVTDAKALLQIYGVTDSAVVARFVEVAKVARKRDRFSHHRKHFTPEYNVLLAFEESATAIRSVSTFVLPGLLQIPDYARALLRIRHSGDKLDGLIAARALRQKILTREHAPDFTFLVDEALLRRRIGGPTVLLAQLGHLRQMSELDNVELRIIPFDADAHLGLWEEFVIMTIPASRVTGEAQETIVYREAGDSEHLVRDDGEPGRRTAQHQQAFDEVSRQALDVEESRALMDRLRVELQMS